MSKSRCRESDREAATTDQVEHDLAGTEVDRHFKLISKSKTSIADAEQHTADSIDRLIESRDLLKRTDHAEPLPAPPASK
jgi:hypothetical protein